MIEWKGREGGRGGGRGEGALESEIFGIVLDHCIVRALSRQKLPPLLRPLFPLLPPSPLSPPSLPSLSSLPSSFPLQITVSSGGMLVMKLDPNDLQFQNVRNFDGTFAYAQNKVREILH